jgi:hypothetical protein
MLSTLSSADNERPCSNLHSSTRIAIYNSFRDGTREKIGDITAKGEAQIAFVDSLGMASGVTLFQNGEIQFQIRLGS